MECSLAVIPARGGSKRIPKKNLKDVAGKPLIAHTVEQAQSADWPTEVVVSTDDEEIKETARMYGARVPFDRPAELATDTAKTREVVTHALEWYEAEGYTFDYVCKLQPTSPLRTPDDIDQSLDHLSAEGAESIISVNEYFFPPEWSLTYDENGHLTEYLVEGYLWEGRTRSQDTEVPLCPNGAVMAATVPAWRKHGTFYTEDTIGYEMPRTRSFDVDEPRDLEFVRRLFNSKIS